MTDQMSSLTSAIASEACSAPLVADPDYDAARAAWNLVVDNRPRAVFRPSTTAEVADAVRYARTAGLGVAVMATGHGIPAVGPDAVLLNTSGMRRVEVDERKLTATVSAGDIWADVHARTAPHGLVGAYGSSSAVGVVGFTSGGGFGWLSRRLGFASSWVRSAEIVTAAGDVVQADDDTDSSDLLWALAGGAGNFGVVTKLTFDLHPIRTVYAGNLYYSLDRAREVAECYAGWAPKLPTDFMSALTFRTFPPAPFVPPELRGRAVVAIRGCHSGAELIEGRSLVDEIRMVLGTPVADTFTELPATALDPVSMDPKIPVGAVQRAGVLRDLDTAVINAILTAAGPDSGSPFAMLELRQLGGAMNESLRGPHPMAHTSAPFTINTIGLAPDTESAEAVRVRQAELYTHLEPALTGTNYLNFLTSGPGEYDCTQTAYSDEDWNRLRLIKGVVDRDNIFRWNRNIPPIAPPDTNTNTQGVRT